MLVMTYEQNTARNTAYSPLAATLLAAHDAAWAVLCALLLLPALATPAWAYVDPSIMTYTIQAVAGVAVALSTVAGVAARRSRRKLMRILDIDENAKRVVEPRVHRVGDVACAAAGTESAAAKPAGEADASAVAGASVVDEPAAVETTSAGKARPDTERRKRLRRSYSPKWRERFVYALIACGFTIATIFVVAPFEVIGGSAGSLVFSLADVWWVTALPALGAIVVLSLLLSALRGRVFNFFLVLVACIGFGAYVQALVLNYGMPAADGGTIVWAEHFNMMVISSVVWAAVILVPLVLSFFNRKRAQGAIGIACVCLLIVQGVGVASLFVAPPAASESTGGMDDLTHTNLVSQTETAMTEEGLYTVSSKNNVIVFVLDTYDQSLLNQVRAQNPDLLSELTDFTEFSNCTGSMIPTRFAVPYLLTGELPKVGEDSATYLAERYSRSSFLSDVHDAGYSIGLYTDSLQIGSLSSAEQHAITDKTINMHKVSSSSLDFKGTFEAMVQIALYRDVPWPFKQTFWYYTDQINGRIVSYNPNADASERVYTMNDPRYYSQLKKQGLEVSDDSSAGAFRFIHLLGAHYPYSLDEDANDLGTDNSTKEKQAQGVLRIVNEYLRQLKELGVYEQSTIVITADHGKWFLTPDPLTTTSTPIMLVKPATAGQAAVGDAGTASALVTSGSQAAGDQGDAVEANTQSGTAQPLTTSNMPVSHHDYLPTVAKALGLDESKYGSGKSVFEITDPLRIRTYITTDSIGLRGIGLREYEIDGDSLVFSNWHETGKYWTLQE